MRTARTFRRRTLAVGLAVAVAAGLTATTIGMAVAETDECPNLYLLGVPGTHYQLTPPAVPGGPPGFDPDNPGWMITQVADHLRPERDDGRLRYEQITYPADVGIAVSYRESTRLGKEATLRRIAEIAQRCGDTRFALIGYSQGAAIAGDALHDIDTGHGPVPASRVVRGGLLSDPRRTAEDHLVGPPVPGVGVDDPRPGGFGELADRVDTFCGRGDVVCDNDPDATLLRPLVRHFADTANVSFVQYVLEVLAANGVDIDKWAKYLDEPNPQNLPVRVAVTAQRVDEYNRMGHHHVYNDLRLDIDGRTATQVLADTIRGDLNGS
jgi:hypothetical protein